MPASPSSSGDAKPSPDGGSRCDPIVPPLDVRELLEINLVPPRPPNPREHCNIRDRELVSCEELAVCKPRIHHAVLPPDILGVALETIRSTRVGRRVVVALQAGEVVDLAGHGPKASDLEEDPLEAAGAALRGPREEPPAPVSLRQVEEDRARLGDGQRGLPPCIARVSLVRVADRRDLPVGAQRAELRAVLLAPFDVDGSGVVREPQLLQRDAHLLAVGCPPREELDRLECHAKGPGQEALRLAHARLPLGGKVPLKVVGHG
mmetsp:Transcript_30833/g.73434  ORF Transcript_30833/g.73434 Transcript_30833/m.73434 type:complete len:263 (-) Transcript_30833:1187-1975(-)